MATNTCGCCKGTEKLTPLDTANRSGLPALAYRVGTHATFLETMKARLSTMAVEVPSEQSDRQVVQDDKVYPLTGLTTREANDPAIALLDGWATVADVLTFYQERIANEGYLRTATERRSVLELARLIGYNAAPRRGRDDLPGVYDRTHPDNAGRDSHRRAQPERAGAGRAPAVVRDG